ncbi:MAG: hypothetical protein J6C19_04665 [Lachnospiraceae bacterium]|nr:hypothetical protein [Lachnospiraceae bacterium]
MILTRGLKLAEYVHAALVFALPVPILYAVTGLADPKGAGIFYMKCLLVAVPVIVTEQAQRHAKGFVAYLTICAALLACVGCVTGLLPWALDSQNHLEAYQLCYCVGMLAETLMLAVKRFRDRLREVQYQKGSDPFAGQETSFLNHPTPSLVWYFAAVYVFGIGFDSKELCDMAFFSAIVYLLISLVYTHCGTTQAYLKQNRRTQGIPKKRLYGISSMMLLMFLLLLFVGMLPAVFMSEYRQYTDVRDWFGDVGPVSYQYQSDGEFLGSAAGGADMLELFNDGEPTPEPSVFINTVFWVIGIACLLAFFYGIFQIVRQVLLDFRNNLDENGDVIEEIKDEESSFKEELVGLKRLRGMESEAEKIRRRYRRTIRRHRKDIPKPYETPLEIEDGAGLKGDEEMKLLHTKYEEVRYGKTQDSRG